MNQRRSVSVVAGAALVLGCAPLSAIYAGLFEWLIPAALAVAVVVGASIGVRALRGNALLQVLAMFAAGLQFCVLMFRSGGEIAGVVPSAETFAHFGALMASAGEDVRVMEVPVEATEGLVFLLVVGVAGLAILTELFTSLLRSPSLVGIPLLALYLVPVALYPESTPWIVFLPGAAGYLWLLMTDNVDRVRSYGRRFSGDGRGLGEWEASPLATTGRWITVAILPLALILPALIPGVTNGLVDEFAEGFGAEAGDGDGDGSGFNRVNPVAGLQGALDTTQTWEVGFVSTDDPDPGRMKMWSASELTEDGFQPDTDAEGEGTQAASGTVDYPDGVHNGVESETYEATFKATGLEDRALPLYDGLSSIDVDGSWRWDSNAETVTSESDTTKDLEYTYTYEKYDYTEDALRAAGPVAADAPYT
ncbi:MAG: DUF3488 domain-containing protein, partial [Stackebrandtia sp.]